MAAGTRRLGAAARAAGCSSVPFCRVARRAAALRDGWAPRGV